MPARIFATDINQMHTDKTNEVKAILFHCISSVCICDLAKMNSHFNALWTGDHFGAGVMAEAIAQNHLGRNAEIHSNHRGEFFEAAGIAQFNGNQGGAWRARRQRGRGSCCCASSRFRWKQVLRDLSPAVGRKDAGHFHRGGDQQRDSSNDRLEKAGEMARDPGDAQYADAGGMRDGGDRAGANARAADLAAARKLSNPARR